MKYSIRDWYEDNIYTSLNTSIVHSKTRTIIRLNQRTIAACSVNLSGKAYCDLQIKPYKNNTLQFRAQVNSFHKLPLSFRAIEQKILPGVIYAFMPRRHYAGRI